MSGTMGLSVQYILKTFGFASGISKGSFTKSNVAIKTKLVAKGDGGLEAESTKK